MVARVDANSTSDGSALSTIWRSRFPDPVRAHTTEPELEPNASLTPHVPQGYQISYDPQHGCRVAQNMGSFCSTTMMPASAAYQDTESMNGFDCDKVCARLSLSRSLAYWLTRGCLPQWYVKLQDGSTMTYWTQTGTSVPVRRQYVDPHGTMHDISFYNVVNNVNINVFTVPSNWRCPY